MAAASASGIKAGNAFVELSLKNNIQKGLNATSKQLKAFGASVSGVGLKIMGVGTAAAAAFGTALTTFAKMADPLTDMSDRTGVAIEALSELGWAAHIGGTDIGTLEKSITKMQKGIGGMMTGSKSAAKAFNQLGISAKNLQGLSPDQQFELIADRISQIQDPALRAKAAMDIFGKSGAQLLPLMKDGAKGIQALRQEARDLGMSISGEQAESAAQLVDAWDRVKRTFTAVVFNIGSALAPELTDLLGTVKTYMVAIANWIKQHKGLVVLVFKVAVGVAAFGAVLVAIGTTISLIGTALGGLSAVIGFISSAFAVAGTVIGAIGSVIAFLVSPIGLAIAAVVAIVGVVLWATGAMGKAWNWLKERFAQVGAFFGEMLGGMKDALLAGDIGAAAEVMWGGLNLAWVHGINFVKGIWASFTGWLVKTLSSAWTGLLAGAEVIWHGLSVGWIETVGLISKGWNVFVGFFQKSWASMQAFAMKAWNTIRGWFDDSVNAESANAAIDAELEKKKQGIDAATDAALNRLEQERQAKRENESRTHEGAMAGIGQAHEDRLASVDAANAQSAKDAENRLNAARNRFKKAVGDAKAKREAAEGKPIETGGKGNALANQVGAAAAEGGALVRGAFNARAIQGGALAITAQEKANAILERIAENTENLNDMEDGAIEGG